MSTMIMKVLCSVLCILAAANLIYSKHVCPKNCMCDLKDGLRRASCTHLNYVDVNMGVPGNVQIYDLSSNSIHKLEDYCFKDIGYKSLIEIDLSNNMIFWMGLHALAGLEKLEYINLSNNRLQVLPPDIFWYNKQLKILDLSGNKFSFTNRPFLSHSNLKVLNLSRSQISHLPDLVFSELPNLTDLDLSKNFMIQLQIDVLKPLTRLKYLALDENNWTCNTVFTDLQTWIINKKMEFIPQCTTKDTHKQFEKIISLVPVHQDREIESMEDLDELWQIGDDNITELGNQTSTEITLTFIDQFNAKFPSIWSLVIGLQLGILLGMVGTYCWLARLCKWRNPRWKSRRQILRERNASHAEDRLLWNTTMRIQNNTETPPIVRRQLSSPEAFCRSDSWEAASFQNFVPVQSRIRDTNVEVGPLRTTRMQSGAETPPPPYRECMNDRIITNIPE